MRKIGIVLLSLIFWINILSAQNADFQTYLKLFPDLSLPFTIDMQSVYPAKDREVPTYLNKFVSSGPAEEYGNYYAIGKFMVNEQMVCTIVFYGVSKSVFILTYKTDTRDGKYKGFNNLLSITKPEDKMLIKTDKTFEVDYINDFRKEHDHKLYKITKVGNISFVKDLPK